GRLAWPLKPLALARGRKSQDPAVHPPRRITCGGRIWTAFWKNLTSTGKKRKSTPDAGMVICGQKDTVTGASGRLQTPSGVIGKPGTEVGRESAINSVPLPARQRGVRYPNMWQA